MMSNSALGNGYFTLDVWMTSGLPVKCPVCAYRRLRCVMRDDRAPSVPPLMAAQRGWFP